MRLIFACLLVSCVCAAARADVQPGELHGAFEGPRSPFVQDVQDTAPGARTVRLSVAIDTDREELTLYLQREVNPVFGPGGSAETGVYEPLCPLPCELSFRPGSYVFGVAASDGPTVRVDPALRLRGGEELTFDYDDRRLLRASGWVLMLTGAAAGGTLLALGQAQDRVAQTVTGGVLSAVCIAAGLWLANLRDRARATTVR